MNFNKSLAVGTAAFTGFFLITAQASVHLLGTSGSYAASESGQLAGGQTLTDWTMEMWVKPDSLIGYQGIFDKHQNWKELSLTVTPEGGFGMHNAWPYVYTGGSSLPGSVRANEWQLLSLVGKGALLSLYVNGNLVGTGNTPGQTSFDAVYTPPWTLGTFNFGLSDYQTLPDANYFKGSLADFRVWDRALGQSELAQHVTQEPAVTAQGLRNWIPFNETSGDTFYDIVGGQNGKYYNVNLSSDSPFSSVPEPSTYFAGFCALSILGISITKNCKGIRFFEVYSTNEI